MYAKYLTCIYGDVCICTHTKSMLLTNQQEALYTYLTYIIEEIWLSHSKYSSHNQYAKLVSEPNNITHTGQNKTN